MLVPPADDWFDEVLDVVVGVADLVTADVVVEVTELVEATA